MLTQQLRHADQLWRAGRETFADPETRYLYEPATVARTEPKQIEADMQRHGLSRKLQKDAGIWRQICASLTRRFQGQVGSLLAFARMDAVRLLELVRGGGFPYLQGQKIGPLWVRMLHDNCGVGLKRQDEVPLPVDIHTAQATVQLGCVNLNGRSGDWAELRSAVQWAWREARAGSEGYALQLDEPLWLLSRMGCRVTQSWPCEFRGRCPVAAFCVRSQLRLSVGDEEWSVR